MKPTEDNPLITPRGDLWVDDEGVWMMKSTIMGNEVRIGVIESDVVDIVKKHAPDKIKEYWSK